MAKLIEIKPECNLWGLQVEMQPVLKHASSIWEEHGVEFVVTCANNGRHSPGSLHYYGYAVDLRTKTLCPCCPRRTFCTTSSKNRIAAAAAKLQKVLGPRYQVLVFTTHIHVEYQWILDQMDWIS